MASYQYVYHMDGVSKTYPGGKKCFENIRLSFLPGVKIGVVGVNGAGKSTLLKIMAGLDKDFTGEAWAAKGANIGYLPQEPQLDEGLDVRGNVMLGVAEKKAKVDRFNEIAMQIAEDYSDELMEEMTTLQEAVDAENLWDLDSQVDVAMEALRCPDDNAEVASLSGGEKRRVALCKLLLEAPDMLLLDEPTNHLDIESREALVEALTAYLGAVVLVSHDMHLLSLVADRLWLVKGGRVTPYDDDLDTYRSQLLSGDKPTTKATGDKPKVKKASRDEILALRAEVRKCEGRLEKLMEMHEKLSAKLADPELYSDKNIADLEVWNKKFAEVEEAMSRAETLWVTAKEKLDTAENKG